ncbi:CCR4-NOT transcription complex subunit 6-like [Triplophysa tibetana]|uniref:CCR4-NOT transcription complex subunit 6-like n=1 Tax=Triplophysa tibetana TaxID=1572043 RepID=A0A5A9P9F7_9TELE|nr:CCR4-NOT transcription complex subunit 6-like [Triplophysa tibetana]
MFVCCMIDIMFHNDSQDRGHSKIDLYIHSLIKRHAKRKYDPPDPRRLYTIMSSEEAASGKKSNWTELEISGRVRSLSSSLWTLTTHLTALHINNNNLSRIPPEIAKLPHLVFLNLSSNKLRSLPAELGNMVTLSPPRTTTPETWVTLKERDQMMPTVMCYNVLCDKYATRQLYGYCPSWALNWEYRKRIHYGAETQVEFNQVAMANSEGSEVMLNRVMTKDNIGVAVLLEVEDELFANGLKELPPPEKQLLLVANAHMHWDPEYSDVKLIQTMMFLSELRALLKEPQAP